MQVLAEQDTTRGGWMTSSYMGAEGEDHEHLLAFADVE